MNVVVPWTVLDPATLAAVQPYAPRLIWTGEADTAYWSLLRDLWDARETVTLVEHDVAPPPGVIDEMAACPRDWCAVPYRCGDQYMTALGCTKFSAALMERNPDTVSRIQRREWHSLDGQIVGTLHMHGETEHVHGPVAWHTKWEGDSGAGAATMSGRSAMRLLYVGGGAYLNGIPAADFTTEDPGTVALCLGSGLYIEAEAVKPLGKKEPAPVEPDEPSEPVVEPAADAEQA